MNLGKNSYIGIALIAVGLVMVFLTFSFSSIIAEAQAGSCGMSPSACPHYQNIPLEVYLAYTVSAVVMLSGIYLIVSDMRSAKLRSQSAEDWKKTISGLKGNEKTIYSLIASADGVMFQGDIVEKSGLSKVKVSRILDGLEARGLLERRRRGMSNIVVLKNDNNA